MSAGNNTDRIYRSLIGLEKTASTSRVWNLAAIATRNADNPEHLASPLFKSPVLNGAVILKHRVRGDERYLFDMAPATGTKLIIPFAASDLSLGGRSLFVEQRGWRELLEQLTGMEDESSHDESLLEAIAELPSMDPFLLREHLKRRNFAIAPTSFAISRADVERMQRFVAAEINKLIELAYKNDASSEGNVSKLVSALLSTDNDERLEPLRLTLRLEGEQYRDGIFSWKGFLYYKWVLSTLWPALKEVLAEFGKLQIVGPRDQDLSVHLNTTRARIQVNLEKYAKAALGAIGVYDRAFSQLTGDGKATKFRDFLLDAPHMFLALGERTGTISHITSFWRYRFPRGAPLKATTEEVMDLLQDFEVSLSATAENESRAA